MFKRFIAANPEISGMGSRLSAFLIELKWKRTSKKSKNSKKWKYTSKNPRNYKKWKYTSKKSKKSKKWKYSSKINLNQKQA